MTPVTWSLDHPDLLVGLVEAVDLRVRPSDAALAEAIDSAVARAEAAPWPPEDVRREVRDLLRRGGFKPTGRSKPASEYLAAAAAGGTFPRINNLVDINNLLSLKTGWPMSILDLDRAAAGPEGLELRYGRAGETYVFNAAGQAIDVGGLVCLAVHGGAPLGNPVKDAMVAKTVPETTRVLGILWTSRKVAGEGEVRAVAEEMAALLVRHAGAARTEVLVIPGT